MKKDHPGVYIPPPLLYAAFFLCSVLLQKWWPLSNAWLDKLQPPMLGWLLIAGGAFFIYPAISRFIKSKNTLVTILPAQSLQTSGIYARTRNPMYAGLLLVYCGIAFLKGNSWTFILLPLLIAVLQLYVIRKEEYYLQRKFGENYNAYRKKVRRWI